MNLVDYFGPRDIGIRRLGLRLLAQIAFSEVKRLVRKAIRPDSPGDFRMSLWERKRLEYFPRYRHTSSPLLGEYIELTDSFWYLFSFREIFLDQIYRFTASTDSPYIIDCGANIGASVIYFKHLYPKARIAAFEPDEAIFRVLERNVRTFHLTDTSIHCKAVWSSSTELCFQSDGGVGGRIVSYGFGGNWTKVQTVRLSDFLKERVDLLKIDIEGAELEVIRDCRSVLSNVNCLFVEYHGIAGEPQALHELLQIIQGAGFRYHIKDANPIMHPFIRQERHSGYDLQLNIFGFRE